MVDTLLPPTGVLVNFGLFYLASGLVYGIPMGVQPMKAASAAILIQGMTPGEVAASGLVIGLFFTLAAVTGAIGWLARMIPDVVVAGIQLGLGIALALLGVRLVEHQPVIGVVTVAVMLLTLRSHRLPAALSGIVVAVLLAYLSGQLPAAPGLALGLHLPALVLPTWAETMRGVEIAVLPQIPLTLTNGIVVTSALARELFPDRPSLPNRATVGRLSLTTGLGNLLAAPFGGYLMCHGASGLAGHFRFGARTAAAPCIIGVLFVLLRMVPDAALGALLLFGGLELAVAARVQRFSTESGEMVTVALMAIVGIATNAAYAFVVGMLLAWGFRRGWLRW
ncbi:MAG: putative sulfate/molybdate transporter [Chloroflexota bacterium]